MKKVFSKIMLVLTMFFVVLSVLVLLMPIFGIEPTVMLTGSMNPQIPVGSICFINKNHSFNDLKVNDIIVYKTPQYRVVHRIVRKTDEGYKTKGDNNKKEDVAVITKDIYYGKYIFSIPYIGYIATNLQNPFGKFFLIAIIVFVVVANYYLNRKEEKLWQQ